MPIPVDEEGICVDALADLTRREPVRAVFITPHHQYPTTVRLTASRRVELLGLAAAKRIAVIEDDYDHEFHYEGRPVFPLATADSAGVVIYIGSLSKIAAPGLRLGYVVAPASLVARLAALRVMIDVQNDRALDLAIAEMIEDGELQRHVRRSRRVYKLRRDAFAQTLVRELGNLAHFSVPAGGLAFWITMDPAVDVNAWVRRARARGIVFRTGEDFALSGRNLPCVRLGFAAEDEASMRERIRELARALP